MIKNVLIACEESQAVTKEFRKLGINAFSCDIQECSGNHPEWHILGDVLPLLNGNCDFMSMDGKIHKIKGKWDMIIAFPPCTYMSRAGARWMFEGGTINNERLKKAMAAKQFFFEFINADCKMICVENPTPLKIVGLPIPTQIIQPYEYGHPYSKRTCLWLKNLPKLKPTNVLTEYKPYLPSNTSKFSRGYGGSRGVAHNSKVASRTFDGVAAAMAEQWSVLL